MILGSERYEKQQYKEMFVVLSPRNLFPLFKSEKKRVNSNKKSHFFKNKQTKYNCLWNKQTISPFFFMFLFDTFKYIVYEFKQYMKKHPKELPKYFVVWLFFFLFG